MIKTKVDEEAVTLISDILQTKCFKNREQFDKYIWNQALNTIDLVILSRIEKGQSISDEYVYYNVYNSTYNKLKLAADVAWDNYHKTSNTKKSSLIDKLITFLMKFKK